jgi:hypothetical protein
MVCDDYVDALRTGRLWERSWQPTEDPYTDSLRAYYTMRHVALAWDYPQLRPAVMSALSESSYNMLQEHKHLFLGLERCWSREIQGAHELRERIPVAEKDSDQDDNDERMAERWCAVQCVLYDAVQHRTEGSEQVSDLDITKYFDDDLTTHWWVESAHTSGTHVRPYGTLASIRLGGTGW